MSSLNETEITNTNAQRNWMIQRIDSIQKECMNKLYYGESIIFETKCSIQQYEKRIKTIERDTTLGFSNNAVQLLLNTINREINQFKSVLFANKTIIFDNFHINDPDENQIRNSFGRLIVLHGLHASETYHEHIK